MSVGVGGGATGLPPVNQTFEPMWVRRGSPATQKAYQTALAFEEMLLEQLSKSLTATSGLGEAAGQENGSASGEEGSSPTGVGDLSSLLPQALTSGVQSAGGLGLAAQLTRQLQSTEGTAQTRATGSSAA
jgi:Rod binding domain-containing protein